MQRAKQIFVVFVLAIMLIVPTAALAQDGNTTSDSHDSTSGDPATNDDGTHSDPEQGGSPDGGAHDGGDPGTHDQAACDEWRHQASQKQDAFWASHKADWEGVRQTYDDRIASFYASEPGPEDEGPFWDSFWSDLNADRQHFESLAENHRNELRNGYFEHCGHDGDYHAFYHHYEDPAGVHEDRSPHYAEGDYRNDPYGDGTYREGDPYDAYQRHPDRGEHQGDQPYAGDDYGQAHYEYSEECRAYDEERRQAADQIHQRFRQEWESLEQAWRDFESSEHSEQEWRDFEAEMRMKERTIRADEDAAFRELEEKYGHNDDCGAYGGYPGPGGPGGPDGRDHAASYQDPECDFHEMERLFREFDDRLRQEKREFERIQEDKFVRFEARMKQKAEAWDSEARDPAEDERFWADFEAEWQRFDERQHQAAESFYGNMERQREDFRMKQESRCKGGDMGYGAKGGHDRDRRGPDDHYGTPYDDRFADDDFRRDGPGGRDGRGPGGMPHDPRFSAMHEEMEILRLECELKAREKMSVLMREIDALWESAGDDPSRHAEIELKMAEAELTMRKAMLDCQKKIQAYWAERSESHFEEGRHHERMGGWQMSGDEDGGVVQLVGKYMTITGDTGTSTLKEIAVQGQVWLDGITTDSYFDDDEWDMGEDGHASWLRGAGEGVRMQLHDNPAGLIKFRSDSGYGFLLQVPSYVDVAAADNGWDLTAGDGEAKLRTSPDSSDWDEATRTLYVSGEAEFFMRGNADNSVLSSVANKHRSEIIDAAENQKLGAEITITTNDDGEAIDEALVYDDVEIDVDQDPETDTLAVTFSADSSEDGKSFVLNVDDQVVEVGGTLAISYFDVDEETGEETESVINKASSLMDVLDATDDDTAEYWIVEDEDGVQVIVSVPNWSTHRVKLSSTGAEVVFPNLEWAPWMGYVATGLVGAIGAAIAMAFMRRGRGGQAVDAPAAPSANQSTQASTSADGASAGAADAASFEKRS